VTPKLSQKDKKIRVRKMIKLRPKNKSRQNGVPNSQSKSIDICANPQKYKYSKLPRYKLAPSPLKMPSATTPKKLESGVEPNQLTGFLTKSENNRRVHHTKPTLRPLHKQELKKNLDTLLSKYGQLG